MLEKKWTLDVESNQYELIQGRLYLIGGSKNDDNSKRNSHIMLESKSVDAKHCVLDATGSLLCIYDLHSKLGTFVNGKRLDPMLKVCIQSDAELGFAEVIGRLHLKENKQSLDLNSSTETFLAPTQRAPRSSLSNTSTRLFSSPDVSMMSSVIDDSFNIPETQHIKQRESTGTYNALNNSENQANDGKSSNDDSFIPETQMPIAIAETSTMLRAKNMDNLMQESLQQTDELIRMCTQDFNENLFGEGVDDETFTSLIIPNIQHEPVILTNVPVCENMKKDASKSSSCNAEMEALNWSAQTSKCTITHDSQNTQCIERDDVCTPDLFDFPELAEINMQGAIGEINEKSEELAGLKEALKTSEKDSSNEKTTNLENPIRDGVSSGDGYAEEIDLMPTQVFIPIPKQGETRLRDPATQVFIPPILKHSGTPLVEPVTTDSTELSLSGKENIPHTDFCLEQTQIFPIATKDAKSSEGKCTSTLPGTSKSTTIDVCDRDLSTLSPTQIFSNNSSNSARQPKKIVQTEDKNDLNLPMIHETLNSTLVPTVHSENAKSIASFFDDIEDSTNKADLEKRSNCFKKPKQSTSSSKSNSSKRSKETVSTINNSQSEDLHLCTPKWISDNFDEISVERNIDPSKKRILFGSDSEEESVELNKLATKKDSKDFDRLLANVKDAKPPRKIVEPKSVLVKQERSIDDRRVIIGKPDHNTNKVTANKSDKKQSSIKGNTQQKSNIAEKVGKTNSKIIIASPEKDVHNKGKAATESKQESTRTSSANKDKRTNKRSVSSDKKTQEPDAPGKRLTRLRSRTSDLDADKASSSTSVPSNAKKRRIQTNDETGETSKKRLTRSRSKTDSQESITSTKSSGSARSTRKGKHLDDEQKRTRNDSCSDTSAEKSKSTTKVSASKDTRTTRSETEHSRKRSTDLSSDDETKRLRSSTRTLQVAMTMVEPKLFQSLLDNSPGNWCLASDPTNADVLVMDKGNRTLKFLIAMAKGIPIVTSKWLESLNSTKSVPRGIANFFRDNEFEKRHKFSLLKSLEVARKRKIFEGYDFLTTPSILPQPAEMKQIIECAGGKVHSEPPPPKPNQKLYVVSSWNDKKHWHKYRRGNGNIRITSSEGIMEAVMRQVPDPLESNLFV